MKILGYSFLALTLPFVILIILLAIFLTIAFTIWMLPKIKAVRKEARQKKLYEGRPLSKEEQRDLKNKFAGEVKAKMGTEDLRKAREELISELKNRDLKVLFKPEGNKDDD